jgi:hypothetical protein
MKLFKFERPIVVRVDVFVKGKCKTFSIDESDAEKVSNELKNMLPNEVEVKLNPKEPLSKVGIQCYEHDGVKKGKYKRFTVYGLTVEQIYIIFMKNLEK